MESHSEAHPSICNFCNVSFPLKWSFKRHLKNVQICNVCSKHFCSIRNFKKHQTEHLNLSVETLTAGNPEPIASVGNYNDAEIQLQCQQELEDNLSLPNQQHSYQLQPQGQQQFEGNAPQQQSVQWRNPQTAFGQQYPYGGYQPPQQYFNPLINPLIQYPYNMQNVNWGYQFPQPPFVHYIDPQQYSYHTPCLQQYYPQWSTFNPQYVYPIQQYGEGTEVYPMKQYFQGAVLQYPQWEEQQQTPIPTEVQEEQEIEREQHPTKAGNINVIEREDITDQEQYPIASKDIGEIQGDEECRIKSTVILPKDQRNKEQPSTSSSKDLPVAEYAIEEQKTNLPSTSSSVLRMIEKPRVIRKVGDKVYEDIYVINTAFKNRIITYRCTVETDMVLLEEFIDGKKSSILKLLDDEINKHTVLKFNMELCAEYVKNFNDKDNNVELSRFTHIGKMVPITKEDDLEDVLNDQLQRIHSRMSEFQERDSGWAMLKICWIDININKTALIKGSSYIKTPFKLALKKACLNIHNEDEFCFKWCIIAALINVDVNGERCSSYDIDSITSDIITLSNGVTLNFKGLRFPLSLKEIKIFEKNNVGISINVFGWNEMKSEVVGPYKLTKEERDTHINLLLLEDKDQSHYILVKDISR